MKLKDIEKNLKKEQDCKSVPDVYARASKAPLNKLLPPLPRPQKSVSDTHAGQTHSYSRR